MRRRLLAGGLASSVVLLLPSGASHAAPAKPFVVQEGRSDGGQRWQQTASLEHRRLRVELSLPAVGTDVGGGMSVPLTGAPLGLYVSQGSGLGPASESEVDGIVGSRARRVVFELPDGTSRSVLVRRAPLAARRRHRALARVRFFVAFFAAAAHPVRVTAVDERGHAVASQPLR